MRLRALRPLPAGQPVLAFCRGIEVGARTLDRDLPADAEVLLPIARLPCVALPAELRFGAAAEGPELASPWPLPNEAVALTLLGVGEPEVAAVRLETGVLRGVLRNRANGLLRPVLYARLNDAGARGVTVEPATPLAEGGAAWRFALPLEVGDLGESGLAVTLFLVGLETPLARVAWARMEQPGPTQLAGLEARVQRLEGGAVDAEARLAATLQRRLEVQQERIDAFVEAAAALLLDRVAGPDAPMALRALIDDLVPDATALPAPMADRAEPALDSGNLALGWHAPERDAGGEFRWMSDSALVVNPQDIRPVAAVELRVRHVFGAPEPRLAAAFDAVPASVEVRRDGTGFLVRVTPAAPAPCRTLRLDALASGIPAEGGASADPRRLSLAVASVTFEYGG